MKTIFTLFVLSAFCQFLPAADQAANSQIRRLYLDLLSRTPTFSEFISAEAELKLKGGYRVFVDKLISSEKFKNTLSWHIVRHYLS